MAPLRGGLGAASTPKPTPTPQGVCGKAMTALGTRSDHPRAPAPRAVGAHFGQMRGGGGGGEGGAKDVRRNADNAGARGNRVLGNKTRYLLQCSSRSTRYPLGQSLAPVCGLMKDSALYTAILFRVVHSDKLRALPLLKE
jgi:hypothetical protein